MHSDDYVANVGATTEALALVVDVDPWPFERFSATSSPPSSNTHQISVWKSISFAAYWNAILEFIAQYKVLYAASELIVVVCHASDTRILYRGAAGDLDLKRLEVQLFTRFLPALSHRGMSLISTGVAKALASLSLVRAKNIEMRTRILVVIYHTIPQTQGISRDILALAFAAKSLQIVIDLASFKQNVTPAWQQACTETAGCFLAFEGIGDMGKWSLQPHQAVALRRQAGKLFAAFLTFFWIHPVAVREACGSHPKATAESTATCCCHNRKVTLGKVCTDCFAVHCLEDGVPESCALCGPQTGFSSASVPDEGKGSGQSAG